MSKLVIISGGQTGVDRGALDAALEAHAPCGGWCPEAREAEDGTIPARYPVHEIPGGGYIRRTRQNVEDSDGTLVLVRTYDLSYLNVAGPRASMEGRGYWYARGLIGKLLPPEPGPADGGSDGGDHHSSKEA